VRYFVSFLVGGIVFGIFLMEPRWGVWGYEQWGYFILQMLPSAAIAAIIGGIGSLLRSRRRTTTAEPAAART